MENWTRARYQLSMITLIALISQIANATPRDPFPPEVTPFHCEQLVRGDQRGAPYDGFYLQAVKRATEARLDVRIIGLDQVLAIKDGRGKALIANHATPLDVVMLVTQLGPTLYPRPVMTGNLKGMFGTDRILDATAGFVQPEPSTGGVTNARLLGGNFALYGHATRHGDTLLYYASGFAMTQDHDHVTAQHITFEHLQHDPDVRIILIKTSGLWGSGTGHGARFAPRVPLSTAARVGFGLAKAGLIIATNGPFAPKRPVTIELVEPADFPRRGTRAEINGYLREFYKPAEPRVIVKSHFLMPWRTLRRARPVDYGPADQRWATSPDLPAAADPTLADGVRDLLKEVPHLGEIETDTFLGDRIDSLDKVDVFMAIAERYGVRLDDDAHFQNARDLARLIEDARVNPGRALARAIEASRPWFSEEQPGWLTERRLSTWLGRTGVRVVGVLGPLAAGHALAKVLAGAGVAAYVVPHEAPAADLIERLNENGVGIILTTRALLREIARSHDLSRVLHRVRLIEDPDGAPPLP